MAEIRDRRPVYVEWMDSCAFEGWRSPGRLAHDGEILPGTRCESFGFLVHETDEAITISSSISLMAEEGPDGDCINSAADPMTIPRCAITLLEDVVFPKRRR